MDSVLVYRDEPPSGYLGRRTAIVLTILVYGALALGLLCILCMRFAEPGAQEFAAFPEEEALSPAPKAGTRYTSETAYSSSLFTTSTTVDVVVRHRQAILGIFVIIFLAALLYRYIPRERGPRTSPVAGASAEAQKRGTLDAFGAALVVAMGSVSPFSLNPLLVASMVRAALEADHPRSEEMKRRLGLQAISLVALVLLSAHSSIWRELFNAPSVELYTLIALSLLNGAVEGASIIFQNLGFRYFDYAIFVDPDSPSYLGPLSRVLQLCLRVAASVLAIPLACRHYLWQDRILSLGILYGGFWVNVPGTGAVRLLGLLGLYAGVAMGWSTAGQLVSWILTALHFLEGLEVSPSMYILRALGGLTSYSLPEHFVADMSD